MSPYRKMAEMPEQEKEVKEMTDKEMYVRIWGMVLFAALGALTLILGYSTFSTLHTDNTAILKAQIESTPMAKDAAQARYLEAKALSDRAMFEQMAKCPPAK